MNIHLYTRKEPPCNWCERTKRQMDRRGLKYQEHVIGTDISRDDFIARFFKDGKERPTVPQVVIDGVRIGGYEATKKHFDWKEDYEA